MGDDSGTARREFRRGLRQKHPLILVSSLAPLVAVLLALQWFFVSGAITVLPERVVLRFPRDDFTHVAYQVATLRRHPAHGLPIYLLGGSSARESIDSAAALADQVGHRTGLKVHAYNLASMNQSFAESMAIMANLPRGLAVVVVAVSANRFGEPPDQQSATGERLLQLSPALSSTVRPGAARLVLPPTLLPGIMRYLVDYYEHHVQRLSDGGPLFAPYQHVYLRPFPPVAKRQMVGKWLRGSRGAGFAANLRDNVTALDALITAGQKRGFLMVLLETPENQELVNGAFDAVKVVYAQPCRAIAETHGIPYLDFVGDAGLSDSDFRDLTHLLAPSRAKFRRYLGDELSRVLRGGVAGGPASGMLLSDERHTHLPPG
jgi:hypothetical protein